MTSPEDSSLVLRENSEEGIPLVSLCERWVAEEHDEKNDSKSKHINFFALLFNFLVPCTSMNRYSSVPNRRAGPNKRAGGKILEKH